MKKLIVLSLFLILGMTGCGPSDSNSAPSTTPTFSMTINKAGTGSGSVVSSPEGIDCGATCATEYPAGTEVTLSATPDAGSVFVSWSDDDCSDGLIRMDAAKNCTATFDPVELVSIEVTPDQTTLALGGQQQFTATGTFTDNSTGDLTDSVTWSSGHPAANFSNEVGSEGLVTGDLLGNAAITATDNATAISGSTTMTVSDQTAPLITVPASIKVSALNATGTPANNAAIRTFLNDTSATDNVDGSITVITNNAPLASFPLGITTVTFSAVDAAGNTGTATATVTVSDQTAPIATAPASITLPALNATGTPTTNATIQTFLNAASAMDNVDGLIAVLSHNAPPASFPLGSTTVTFTAIDAAGNPGTATATVTVTDQTKPVITRLGLSPVEVAIGTAYVDGGATAFDLVDGNITTSIVTVNPVNPGIAATYFVTYDVFDAAGNAATQVSRTVIVKAFHTLTVAKSGTGTGSGTITSFPLGINCGVDCTENYPVDTIVNLTASPAADSIFSGWSGDADCFDGSVTMSTAKHCIATFDLATVSLTVTKSGLGSGFVTSSPPGIDCGATCTGLFIEGNSVTLQAVPDFNAVVGAWSGPCAGSGLTCTLTLNADTDIDVTFNPVLSISGFISGVSVPTAVTLKDDSGTVIETVNTSFGGGSFVFQQPPGTYTVTPAASAKTLPTSRSVTLTSADVPVFFSTTHTIRGTVSYGGSKTGRIYVALHSLGNPQRIGYGTSLDFTGPGSIIPFAIKGVPGGSYDVKVSLDHLDTTLRNASNPTGNGGSVNVNADMNLPLITLVDPAAVTPQTPASSEVLPQENGALFFWDTPEDANALEIADSYRIYYKAGSVDVTTSVFDTAVTVSLMADGIIPVPNLVNGTRYTFIVTALVGGVQSTPTAPKAVIPAIPTGGVTVSGTISFPSIPATPEGSTLYAVIDDDASVFVVKAISVTAGDTSVAYTIKGIPSGTYNLFMFIDVGNNRVLFDLDDLRSESDFFGENPLVTVGTAPVTGQNLTIQRTNAFSKVLTRHHKNHDGSSEGYSLIFEEQKGSKLPVKMVITGPNIPDTDAIPNGGTVGELLFWLPFDLPRPAVGDMYTFETSYLGDPLGTAPEILVADVTVLDSFAVPVGPIGVGTGQVIPTFSWTAPAAPPFRYDIELNIAGDGNPVWFTRDGDGIPGTQISILFNDDGSATVSTLSAGTSYNWSISVMDRKGNTATLGGIRFTP